MYGIGYTAWALIGAIALRRWRLVVLRPALALLDWVARGDFIHAAIKAIRQPTSECRWNRRHGTTCHQLSTRTSRQRNPRRRAPIVGSSPTPMGDGFIAAPIGIGGGDGLLPLASTLIIAVIGGLLTLAGAVMRTLSCGPAPERS